MEIIEIKRLRAKAVFKIVFIGLFCSFIPFFSFMGLLASQGLVTMRFGETLITGLNAILLGPLYGLLFTLVFGFFIGVFISVGLIIYSKLKSFKIEYYRLAKNEDN